MQQPKAAHQRAGPGSLYQDMDTPRIEWITVARNVQPETPRAQPLCGCDVVRRPGLPRRVAALVHRVFGPRTRRPQRHRIRRVHHRVNRQSPQG